MREITDDPLYAPFKDLVAGGMVRYYSAKGKVWMAKGPWSLLRVEAPRNMPKVRCQQTIEDDDGTAHRCAKAHGHEWSHEADAGGRVVYWSTDE